MSLLAIGGQLLGGILGNRAAKKAAAQQRAWALEDQAMQWVRHREASEAGGFNPLATLGLSQGVAPTPASSNNYMGEAIASSALILADNYAKTRQAAMGRQVEDLRRQRDILTRKLTNQTIRPKIAGVYGIGGANGSTGVSGPSVSAGNASGRGVGSVVPAVRPLVTSDPVDPRREVENKPATSGPGFMVVDNPWFPRTYFPTIDGDEPLDILQAAPALVAGVPQWGYHYGQYSSYGGGRESRPSVSREEGLRIREERLRKGRDAMEWRKPRLRFDPNHRDGYYYP